MDYADSRHVLSSEQDSKYLMEYQLFKDPDQASLNEEARLISVSVRGGGPWLNLATPGGVGWPLSRQHHTEFNVV